jgi:hypothetical protein
MILMRPDNPSVRMAFEVEWERYLHIEKAGGDESTGLATLVRAVQLGGLSTFRPLVERTATHAIRPPYAHMATLAEQVRKIARDVLEGVPCPV